MFDRRSFSAKSFSAKAFYGLLLYVIAVPSLPSGGGYSFPAFVKETGSTDKDVFEMIQMILTSGVLDG